MFILPPVRRGPPAVGVLILAVASANLGLSLLSPVITQLRQDLMATAAEAQMVLSGFMMSVALAQLMSGSLSDRFGRRYILLGGAAVFSLGGVGAMLAASVEQLVGFRVLQGAGAAACLTMGRVIINDSFEGADAARKMSIVSSAQAIVPLLGFAFGGLIAEFIGWRGSIAIMVLGGFLILWLAACLIAESRQGQPVPFRLRSLVMTYSQLAINPGVRNHGLTSGFAVGMFFVMGGAMPYEFARLGASPIAFGFMFAMTSVGYILGNMVNGLFVGRLGLGGMAMLGSFLTVVVPAAMLAGNLTDLLSPIRLSALCFCFGFCNGLVIANAMICSMRAAGLNSGAGTGLLGAMQMLIGGVGGSVIIGLGGAETFTVTAAGLLVMSTMGAATSFLGSKLR